jgi:hypothetical protein
MFPDKTLEIARAKSQRFFSVQTSAFYGFAGRNEFNSTNTGGPQSNWGQY